MEKSQVKRIGIASIIIIMLLGLFLSYGASNYIKNDTIKIAGQIIVDGVENNILKRVDHKELVSSNDVDVRKVDKFLNELMANKKIKLVKVWSTGGVIVNSTDKSLKGKNFPIEGELANALKGDVQYELSTLDKKENEMEKAKFQRLYEIYIPLLDDANGSVIGVFEIYWGAEDIYQTFLKSYYTIFSVLAIGYFVAFVGMFIIMKKLFTIISQKDLSMDMMAKRLNDIQIDREKAYLGTVQSLLAALNAKDNYTAGHSIRVADYSIKIARRLGLPEDNIKLIEEAALFHDIGKIAVPEQVLNKPGKLSEEEYEMIKQHPVVGEQIVRSSGILESRLKVIRHHHERIDGKGYPDGLVGRQIPLESQILAVADTFDTMTSDRPYRKAMPISKAVENLYDAKGIQLNDQLVDVLVDILAEPGL